MKTVGEFTYLCDRVSEGGGCEDAVTARTRCGRVRESEMGILRRTEIHGETSVWSTVQRSKKNYGLDDDVGFE